MTVLTRAMAFEIGGRSDVLAAYLVIAVVSFGTGLALGVFVF